MTDPLADVRSSAPATLHTPGDRREYEQQALALNEEAQRQLIQSMKRRISRVRTTIGYEMLPPSDVRSNAMTSLFTGYGRAHYERLAAELGYDETFWKNGRRKYGRDGRDRTVDHQIAISEFGDRMFGYYPDPPLTFREVLDAARIEFRDMIAAPGTAYYQQESQNRVYRDNEKALLSALGLEERPEQYYRRMTTTQYTTTKMLTFDEDGTDEHAEIEYIDEESMDRILNAAHERYKEDSDNPFGPTGARLLAVASEVLGEGMALYWFLERTYFRGQYTELMRFVGGLGEDRESGLHSSVRRDLTRKLPQANELMKPVLETDGELRHLAEMIFGEEVPA